MFSHALKRANDWLQIQLRSDSTYLIPLRLFIGIGWVRAGLEKFIDAGWPRGTALVDFFNQHSSSSIVTFPFYRDLIQNVFAPNVLALSWLIMMGQILVGLAILTGAFTNFALLCGLFMNVNFILSGEVSPSAFYVVIQVVLLVTNVGYYLGLDAMLAKIIPVGLLVAQPYAMRKYWRLEQGIYLCAATALMFLALAVIPYIRDFSPHSVDDPAMVLLVLAVISGLSALITAVKIPQKRKLVYRPLVTRREFSRPRERGANNVIKEIIGPTENR
jgi:thiosulfate dehydrogenase [quinone] large subunit